MKRLIIAGLVLILSLTVAFGQQRFGVYTTLDEPLAKALFDEYQKETGIVLNWQRLSGGEVEARLEAEKANPQASIWVGGVGLNHISAKLKGLTAPSSEGAEAATAAEHGGYLGEDRGAENAFNSPL